MLKHPGGKNFHELTCCKGGISLQYHTQMQLKLAFVYRQLCYETEVEAFKQLGEDQSFLIQILHISPSSVQRRHCKLLL